MGYILQSISYYHQSTKYLDIFSFPYLYEEIRVILYTWNNKIFGPICSYLIDKLYLSANSRNFFITLYIILSVLIPLMQSVLFLYFVLFDGDLRYNLYLLPFSLLSWIFRHLIYYFKTFFDGTCNYIRELIIVNAKIPLENTQEYVTLYPSQLEFILTDKGRAFGITEETLPLIIKQFLQYSEMNVAQEKLLKIIAPLNILIIFLRCLSWFTLVLVYWPDSFSESVLIPVIFGRRFLSRPYATEAFQVWQKYQADLEKATNNAYKSGHLIASDLAKIDPKGNIPYQVGLTHGPGSAKNPSEELHPSKDIKGNPVPQRGTFPEKPTTFNSQWINPKPIAGSEAYFKDPIVDANMKQHSPHEP